MMTRIGDELQAKESIILGPCKTIHLQALDICLAPGGYSATVLKYNRYAKVCGLSLPIDEGGHDVLLPGWQTDHRVKIKFTDITMLAAEIGFPDLPLQDHPYAPQFSNDSPFDSRTFDVVFCDGQVLHTHVRANDSKNEAFRLTSAQIIIALQKVKPGGTMVMLLHQAYSPHTIRLLESFNHFSQISLFKPTVSHTQRSSFYLVAKWVESKSEAACQLLHHMRGVWSSHTVQQFGVDLPEPYTGTKQRTLQELMESFGEKLVSLAEPLWELQIKAMERMFL
jgi:23S rRNA U2552 (ribose-2'-O)-methylase RlmE/FtsJ